MKDFLTFFLLELYDKGLIENENFVFENEADKFCKKNKKFINTLKLKS